MTNVHAPSVGSAGLIPNVGRQLDDAYGIAGNNPRSIMACAMRNPENVIGEFRAMAPLPLNAQLLIDQAVLQVALERLTVAADTMAAGLRFGLQDWLSVPELYWESESKTGGAKRTMMPGARGERHTPDRKPFRLPVYCTSDDFSLNIRTLLASERAGQPLDTTEIQQCVRRVNESIEDAFIFGANVQITGGYTAPGLTNAPNLGKQVMSGGKHWDDPTNTGTQILGDLLNAITVAQAAHKYGPYNLYVPTSYGVALMQDFKTYAQGSIMERLQQVSSGGRNLVVRVADRLPANTVILVQMTSDTLQIVDGQQPTEVSWDDGPGWEKFFVMLACEVPRVRSDYDGNSGVVQIVPS